MFLGIKYSSYKMFGSGLAIRKRCMFPLVDLCCLWPWLFNATSRLGAIIPVGLLTISLFFPPSDMFCSHKPLIISIAAREHFYLDAFKAKDKWLWHFETDHFHPSTSLKIDHRYDPWHVLQYGIVHRYLFSGLQLQEIGRHIARPV